MPECWESLSRIQAFLFCLNNGTTCSSAVPLFNLKYMIQRDEQHLISTMTSP